MPAVKNKKVKRIQRNKGFPSCNAVRGEKRKKVEFTLVLVKDKKGIVRAFATTLPIDVSQAETLFDLYKNIPQATVQNPHTPSLKKAS